VYVPGNLALTRRSGAGSRRPRRRHGTRIYAFSRRSFRATPPNFFLPLRGDLGGNACSYGGQERWTLIGLCLSAPAPSGLRTSGDAAGSPRRPVTVSRRILKGISVHPIARDWLRGYASRALPAYPHTDGPGNTVTLIIVSYS
jgi:hypothetical protein